MTATATKFQDIASQSPYDVNFDARAWPESQFTTARLERRTVEIYLHAFGPHPGNYGLERTIRMAALKYRGAPDTDWAICPARLKLSTSQAMALLCGQMAPQQTYPSLTTNRVGRAVL